MLCLSDEIKFEEMRQLREHEGKNDIISIFVCLTAFFKRLLRGIKRRSIVAVMLTLKLVI